MCNIRNSGSSSSAHSSGHVETQGVPLIFIIDGADVTLEWGRNRNGYSYASTTPRNVDLEDAAIAALDGTNTVPTQDEILSRFNDIRRNRGSQQG